MVQSASRAGGIVRFGAFELDLRTGELRRSGVRITLQDQPLAILTALLERPGALVTRDELRQRLWPADTFVDFEHGLNAAVKRLRDALGDSAETPRFVETLPRRGYRFIAPFRPEGPAEPLHSTEAEQARAEAGRPAVNTVRRRWITWAALATVTVVAAAAFVIAFRRGAATPDAFARPPQMTRLTHDAGLTMQPTLSSNGELLAYASDRGGDGNLDIWIQRFDGSAPVRLTSHPADDDYPSLSPDGRQIAFRSKRDGGNIYVMPAHSRGQPRLIAPTGVGPRFSPDGKWIAYHVGTGDLAGGDLDSEGTNSLYITSPRGGTPRRIAAEFGTARTGVWSPDAEYILFRGKRRAADVLDWWVVPAAGGTATKTGLADIFRRNRLGVPFVAGWLATNRLLVVAGDDTTQNLWTWTLSPANWQASPEGQRVTTTTGQLYYPSAAGNRLVFSLLTVGAELWSLPVPDSKGRVNGEPERQTRSAFYKGSPFLAADGSVVSFLTFHPEGTYVWVRNLNTGVEERVIAAVGIEWPVLSPDGARIAYRNCGEDGKACRIEAIPAIGGPAERLCDRCGWGIPQDWSSDGRSLVYLDNQDGRMHIAALDLSTGESRTIVKHPSHNLYQAHVSSDARWLVFMEVAAPGRSRLYVAPFRGARVPQREWVALTTGDAWDDKPRLSLDGSLLYFTSNRDGFTCIWGQPLRGSDKYPSGAPFPVYHSHSTRLSIGNVRMGPQEISVARDRLVFNMAELTGNIWSLPLNSVPDR